MSFLVQDSGIIKGTEYVDIEIATMDQLIANYATDQNILNGIISKAIFDIHDVYPQYQAIPWDQSTITNSEGLKNYYEGTLQITNIAKPDWSVIEQWFNDKQGIISIDDGSALLSSNKDIVTDPIITFSAKVTDLSTDTTSIDVMVNNELKDLSFSEFRIFDDVNPGVFSSSIDNKAIFTKNPGNDFSSAYDPSTGRVTFDYDLSRLIDPLGIMTGSEHIEIVVNGGNISVDDGNALLSSNIDVASDPIITISADLADLSTNSPSVDAFINGESINASLGEFSLWKGIEDSQLMGGFNYSVFNKNPETDFLSAYDPSTGRVKYDYDLSYLLEDGGLIMEVNPLNLVSLLWIK